MADKDIDRDFDFWESHGPDPYEHSLPAEAEAMAEPEDLIPDEPLCPLLEALIMEARTCGEVCEVVKSHDRYCERCNPGLRRAE
jgi:hypothetical protein